jgi:cytochrome c553
MGPIVILRSTAVAFLMLFAWPALAQDANHGSTLYHQTCITCHGLPPSGGPELAPNNPGLISQAINGLVPSMSFLRNVYSASDLADIAAYIASLQAPPPPVNPQPQFDYSDLWWNPNESGWGLNIVQHGKSVLFCVMFTYAAPNQPEWYVIPGGTWNSATLFSGAVYRVTGSAANAPFVGAKLTQVGTATIAFTSQSTGNFTMSVDGVQVTNKSIERQPY